MSFLQSKFWLYATIIYPLLFIWQGLDLTDAGFNLVQFSDFFENPERHANVLWLSNLLGALWHESFEWLGYIGFKIAYVLNIYLMLYLVWMIIKPYDSKKIGFFALFLTLAYVTKAGGDWISYNAFSSLFYLFVVFFIYKAYQQNSLLLYWIAGIFAGLNIFVRLPNLLDILLIVSIIFVAYENSQLLFKAISSYLLGYIFAIVLALSFMAMLGQYDSYIKSLTDIFGVTADTSGHHGSGTLLKLLIFDYSMVLFMAVSVSLLAVYFIPLVAKQKEVTKWIVVLLVVLLALKLFPILAMWKWLYIAVLYFGLVYVYFDKNSPKELKLMTVLAFLYLALIPLGSGNGIRNAVHGAWLAMPLVLIYFASIGEISLRNKVVVDAKSFDYIKKLFIFITLVFSLVTAYEYSYRDSNDRFAMIHSMDHPKLKGTFTTEKRAKVVEEILSFLEPIAKNRELFAYGKISTISYLLDKGSPLSHPWAVDHLSAKKFEDEFVPYFEQNKPLVVRARYSVSSFEWPYDKRPLDPGKDKEANRILVDKVLANYDYEIIWSNEYFEVLDMQK